MAEKKLMTTEGLEKLQEELQNLTVVRRKEIAQKLKEARAQGDLSENAEYDAARDEQREMESRIEEIQAILKNVEVVQEGEIDKDVINLGSFVKLYDCDFNEEIEYKIVGSTEANSLQQKISNESPLGKALLNKRAGDEVDVETPGGVCKYKVLEVTR